MAVVARLVAFAERLEISEACGMGVASTSSACWRNVSHYLAKLERLVSSIGAS